MFSPWRVQIIVGVSLCAEPSEVLKTKPRVRTTTLWGEKSRDWQGPGALEDPVVVFSGGHNKSHRLGGLKHRNLLSHSTGGEESEIEASAGLSSSEEALLAVDGTPLPQSPLSLSACLPPAAAAAESLQSCPALRDPLDGSPPGSPVPGVLQARTLEGVAISFSSGTHALLAERPSLAKPLRCQPWGRARRSRMLRRRSNSAGWAVRRKRQRQPCHGDPSLHTGH